MSSTLRPESVQMSRVLSAISWPPAENQVMPGLFGFSMNAPSFTSHYIVPIPSYFPLNPKRLARVYFSDLVKAVMSDS